MRRRLFAVCFGVLVTLLFFPRHSFASWFQWGTEGSYVHQTAHLLFFGALLFFIYEMRREGLEKSPGFRYLTWACWLLAIWNVDAVVGHSLEWSLSNPVILGHGLYRRLLMEDFYSWLYYITKFDHFALLIPAFYLFYRGLKAFVQGPGIGL